MPEWFFDLLKKVDAAEFGYEPTARAYSIRLRKGKNRFTYFVTCMEAESANYDAMREAADRALRELESREPEHAHP